MRNERRSDGDLDLIVLDPYDAALIVTVPSSPRTTDHLIAVGSEALCERVDLRPASRAECDVGIACSGDFFYRVIHFRFRHDFKPCAAVKGDKIRAETCFRIVVSIV